MPLRVVRKPGRRYLQIVGTVAGRRIQKSAKTADRALAEAKRLRLETELEHRDLYGPQAVASFAEAMNLYLDAGGEDRYLTPLLDAVGRTKLKDITPQTLTALAARLYPDAAPATVNRQLYTPFIAVMNCAAENGLTPVRKWRRPKGHNRRTRFRWLWPEEVEKVWKVAPDHVRVMLDLYCGTGMREGEGVALDWANVRLSIGQAWLDDTKTDTPRRIELPARTVAALANLEHREGKVLLNRRGRAYRPIAGGGGILKTALAYWCKEAGVTPFTAHVMRHTWATWFYSATLDPMRLKALGGWQSGEYERYCHLAPRGLADELRRYGWTFDGTGGEILEGKERQG